MSETRQDNLTWSGFEDFTVVHRCIESDVITSFYLSPKNDMTLPEFLPGPFLTFELTVPGIDKPIIRQYSLSSAPKIENVYRISVKREPAPPNHPEWM